MNLRHVVGEVIFWLHLPIVLVWLGLFFVPESLIPGKTIFHFWFIMIVFAAQMLWGLAMLPIRGYFGAGVCPLTTLTQWVRGIALTDKRNYDHTFLAELCTRWHIQLSAAARQAILYSSLVLVVLEYALQ